MTNDVFIEGDRVSKYFKKDVLPEYQKAIQLYEISNTHNFSYPEPLSYDQNGWIEFRRISCLSYIRDEYIKFMRNGPDKEFAKYLFMRAGEILAHIHNNLILDCTDKWKPGDDFISAMNETGVNDISLFIKDMPCTHLHCDYGFSNIYYVKTKNTPLELVVLDSSPNDFVTFKTDIIGPVYIDIGNMISCIEGLVRISNYPWMKWELLPEVRNSFLDGYRNVGKHEISLEWVNKFSYATAKCYLQNKYTGKIRSKLALSLLFNQYKNNSSHIISRK